MLTACASEEDKLFAHTLGVDDYLTKPFSRDELIVRTRNILNNRIVRKVVEKESEFNPDDLPNVDAEFINTIKNLVERNIADSLLTVSFLASHVAMSERQLLRKLKSLTGYSAIQFINEIKLLLFSYLFKLEKNVDLSLSKLNVFLKKHIKETFSKSNFAALLEQVINFEEKLSALEIESTRLREDITVLRSRLK